EQLAARSWDVSSDMLNTFASAVRRSASYGQRLESSTVEQAHVLLKSVLDGEVGSLFAKLQEAARGPLLVKFFVHDAELAGMPWETLCKPGETHGFWATAADVLPVRGVLSGAPWQPREVRGAVRVLAIAPTGDAGVMNLKQALAERLSTGEMEWLDPIEGLAAKTTALFDRLRREPVPHVIHFLGHGRVENGIPELRLADENDEETWIEVEVLAQQLAANFQGTLRLVILEACAGAHPGAFASAAEILARSGADGVVAHLWPVKAEAAQTYSTQFYRSLAGTGPHAGDMAIALNEARRAILGSYDATAEAFSAVLYLRGPHARVFQFRGRKMAAPQSPAAAVSAPLGDVPSGLSRITKAPFSLVLGDHWADDPTTRDAFRDKLQKELSKLAAPPPTGLPLSTLTQWFALRRGVEKLGAEFQKLFRATTDAPAFLGPLAKIASPGVHTTMLRMPWFEQALAEQHPERTIYVIQPDDDGVVVSKREAGSDEWEELDKPPVDVDMDQEFVVLRPCRGYTTEQVFTRPLLTDDDYALHLRDLWNTNVLPVDLANAILRTLGRRPAMIVGLSLLSADHRLLLHNLYVRGVPRDTLAIVDVVLQEGKLWTSGAGLPGRDEGVEAVETTADDFLSTLERIVPGNAS
ncbi:MAG TPA: CHAT domain-containing protein, partial [Polyangium sp.]|nr:CHAT domain-containing protein [Polyangium sp.]